MCVSLSKLSNSFVSAKIGTKPNLCAKISSAITLVFCRKYTLSIAMDGTSDMIILLNAFANAADIPSISNSSVCVDSLFSVTLIVKFFRNCSSENASSSSSVAAAPPLYALKYALSCVCLFSAKPTETNFFCISKCEAIFSSAFSVVVPLDDDVGGFVFFFAAGMMVNSGGVKRTNERMNERDSSAPLF